MPLSSVVGAQSIVKPGVCTSTTRPASPYDGQVIYMTDVDQTAVWDGTQWTVLAPIAGNRNILINGAMNVWQRGTTSGTLGVGGGSYIGPDRWWFYNNGFTTTMSQQLCGATLPEFRNCLRIQRTSGQTSTVSSVFFSPQETINSVRLAGKNATLSFYARASSGISSATALSVAVFTGTGTDQNNLGGGAYTGSANPISSSPVLTTSWQRFTATGAISSTTTELGVQIGFIPAGTAGASDWFEITGIQLEEGAVATPFEFEDYGVTLAKCQRYYWRMTANAIYNRYGNGAFNVNSALSHIQHPSRMRIPPASVDSLNVSVWDFATVFASTSIAIDTVSEFGTNLQVFISSGITTYRPIQLLAGNASSYIGFSAEL